jgi:hypothetical protein
LGANVAIFTGNNCLGIGISVENTDAAQELVGLNGDVDINPVLFFGSVHREGKGFAVALARASIATEAKLVIGNGIAVRVA